MIPWIHLDTGPIPGEETPLRLMQRGEQFSIFVGPTELMSNRLHASEKALATLICGRLRDRPRVRILIGGLGMGFTLRAALDALGPDATIVVAELVPAVATWARGPLAHLFDGSLDDPRVDLRVDDVGRQIRAAPGQYDAILLDVDNGPGGLMRAENDRLYGLEGLSQARTALRADGILGIWSQGPDAAFTTRLKRSGYTVEEERVRAHGSGGRRHVLWLATRPASGAKPSSGASRGTRPADRGRRR
ncbi:spermidine synthase [Methylobacterium gnaphalii]|uniref:Spermidine synthase n=1 Tax=Methylobacterium gnaphalii TaxID=1010610 RepID=A0A512JJH2_9HYPH|nr:hypothetical protein [Methylobacterium gnaphalii]GEP10108.1 spermidine synthase [Methylobacterium gnaphalii]GJD70838.1 Polyamine aminopropyltransferase [Methylobacterium gnaphalii]GLS48378.1 spermidine synthase [Methylobacterium gnaphalii]